MNIRNERSRLDLGSLTAWSGMDWEHECPAISNLICRAPGTDQASCSDVDWHRDMTRDYPWVADGCHEVVVVDGQNWARFEAEFERFNRDGTNHFETSKMTMAVQWASSA